MDLSNIRAKLQTQNFAHYQTFNEFVGDCRLIFDNCAIFNEVSTVKSLPSCKNFVFSQECPCWNLKYSQIKFWENVTAPHPRILSADSKVRTTLYCVINSTTGFKYCLTAFAWMVNILGFHPQTQKIVKIRTILPCIINSTTGFKYSFIALT